MDEKVVVKRFEDLYEALRKSLPHAQIDYISIKPSPSRQHLQAKFDETNKMIKKYLKGEKKSAYIDITGVMYDDSEALRRDIFREDNLHMNPKGYQLWKGLIEPYLKK